VLTVQKYKIKKKKFEERKKRVGKQLTTKFSHTPVSGMIPSDIT
jgi:hypothetical protein